MTAAKRATTLDTLKPYPAYKDSGVEWIGKVPEGWAASRFRHSIILNPKKSECTLPQEVSFIPMEAVGEDGSIDTSTTRPIEEVFSGYTYFAEGDLVLAKVTPCFENGKGAVAKNLTNGVGFGSTEFHVLRGTERMTAEFAYYLTLSHGFRKLGEGSMYGAGGQKRVGTSFIREVIVPTPPPREQAAIAAFLDHETARIDDLVREQELLLEDLTLRKRTLCFEAVTVGCKPNIRLKRSEHPWFSQVPEHWKPWKVSRVFNSLGSGTTPPSDTSDYYGGIIPWVNTGDLPDGPITSVPKSVTELALHDFSTLRVYPNGTVIMAMYGATIGKLGTLTSAATVNQACCAFVAGERVSNRFAFYWLFAMRSFIVALGYGGGQPNISQQTIRNMSLYLPEWKEQEAIADFLDQHLAQIDALVQEVRTNIEDMKLLRSALITAATTGKIDVRGWRPT